MNRREMFVLPAAAAALGLVAGSQSCGGSPVDPQKSHSTAMFLLLLVPGYLQDAYGPKDQNQLDPTNLLRRVRPDVFQRMRGFLRDEIKNTSEQQVIDKYSAIHAEMYYVTSGKASEMRAGKTATDDPPYTSPDICPCYYQKACSEVETLLNF
jgi:hypothetical protein